MTITPTIKTWQPLGPVCRVLAGRRLWECRHSAWWVHDRQLWAEAVWKLSRAVPYPEQRSPMGKVTRHRSCRSERGGRQREKVLTECASSEENSFLRSPSVAARAGTKYRSRACGRTSFPGPTMLDRVFTQPRPNASTPSRRAEDSLTPLRQLNRSDTGKADVRAGCGVQLGWNHL